MSQDGAAFVYRLTNTVTGKHYIGICASKVQRRWRRHVNSANANKARNRNCPALHGAIRKYGEQVFTVETLYEAVSWLEAQKVERGLIAQYGTMAPNGYNLTCGGEGVLGRKVTDEQRKAMGDRSRGRKHSPESKARMSASLKQREWRPEEKRRLAEMGRKRAHDPALAEERKRLARLPSRVAAANRNIEKAVASNRGRKASVETKQKMSAWQIGKQHSDETKARIGAANKGKKRSLENLERMRNQEFSPEHRAKIKAALKDRHFSPEHKARISEGLRKRWERWREARANG